jgi:hypothetical protein
MTKAYVTIAVDIDTTNIPVQTGLGESSNPQHVSKSRAAEAKREFIWEVVYDWVSGNEGFIQVKEVRIPKA